MNKADDLNTTPEDWEFDPAMYDVKPEDTTCFKCSENKTCKYAWDSYNTGGDCLASK